MNLLGKITIFLLLLLLGTCFIVRRFPDETSNIDKVRKSNPQIKLQKKEIKLPEIPRKKNLKLKPWKKENQIFYTLEEDDIQLLCLYLLGEKNV